jgi:small subunit ribosomal protein S4
MAAKLSGKAYKYSRREGTDLGLKRKGINFDQKTRRARPGQHGSKVIRLSNYGIQFREKQKIKRIYGLTERQFRNCYAKAVRKKGATGTILLQILESRLDNVVFRAGFGVTRPEARQLVGHGSILVDGKRVDIASYSVEPGAIISIAEKSKSQKRIDAALLYYQERTGIEWIETDMSTKSATFKRLPLRDELPAEFNEQLIVELYSK